MTTKTYARCLAVIDDNPIGAYTVGKEYEALPVLMGADWFDIIDDNGDGVACWWDDDPDVIWERVER